MSSKIILNWLDPRIKKNIPSCLKEKCDFLNNIRMFLIYVYNSEFSANVVGLFHYFLKHTKSQKPLLENSMRFENQNFYF